MDILSSVISNLEKEIHSLRERIDSTDYDVTRNQYSQKLNEKLSELDRYKAMYETQKADLPKTV